MKPEIQNLDAALNAMPKRVYPAKKTPKPKPLPEPTTDEIRAQLACRKKVRYRTAQSAKSRANFQEANEPGLKLYIYKCSHCHRWHLTKEPQLKP